MSESHQHLDDDALNDLLTQHRRNLMYLEKQDAKYGGMTPLHVVNSIENEQQCIAALRETLQQRGVILEEPAPPPPSHNNHPQPQPRTQIDNTPSGQNNNHPQPQTQTDNTPPPKPAVPLAAQHGSPFVVGRPLRPDEPIFGREDTFRFIADSLAKFSSVNLVGERRMGKTSVLNHLMAHQDKYLIAQPKQPPLVLARIDLQGNINDEKRFYGTALRELLANLPPSRSKEAQHLSQLHARLDTQPEATYDEFDRTLRQLRDQRGICVRPVLIIDEFERLLSDENGKNFPYPHFFDGLRALMTADLIAFVVASRQRLIEYFTDPTRPQSLTSTFPNYFQLHTVPLLDDTAADALLTQPNTYPLSMIEVAEACRWASGHPCHLQVAGQAYYEAKSGQHPNQWMRQRREEMKSGNCATGQPPEQSQQQVRWKRIFYPLRWVCWMLPLHIGRFIRHLGANFADTQDRLWGFALLTVIVLAILGIINREYLLEVLLPMLGAEGGG